jgi:flagellar biosynthesis protein FlhB
VPRVGELATIGSFGTSWLVLLLAMPHIGAGVRRALEDAVRYDIPKPAPYIVIASASLVIIAAGAAGGVLTSVAASGALLFKWPDPKLARVDPIAGFKKLFSREAVLSAVRAVGAGALVSCAISPCLRDALDTTGVSPPTMLAARGYLAVSHIMASIFSVGLALAFVALVFERWKWRRRLRMTFDELKRELRQTEVDPALRNRRSARHRSYLSGSLDAVQQAAFVVTNPTHVAIGLAYRPPEIAVPRVVVSAQGRRAQLLRDKAKMLRIPIVENPELARRLLVEAEIEACIPRQHYVAVAQVVAALTRSGLLNES